MKSSTFTFTASHLLYGRLRPYLNKVLLPDFSGHCSSEVFPIKADKGLDKRYLFHWISSPSIVYEINKTCTGARMPRANMKEIMGFEIPLPPLPEQKRIVSILDEAFAAIERAKENAEKNLANARELFESYLNRIFTQKGKGWEEATVGEICTKVEYGTSSKSQRSGKYPVLRMGNIQNRELDWSDLVFTDNEEDFQKHSLRDKDVLFNRTNSAEHVGKTCIYRGDRPALFAGYLIRLHYNRKIVDGEYLNYFLNSDGAREHGKSVMSQSVNQANINGTKLKAYRFPLAPIEHQRKIVSLFNTLRSETENLESIYQQKLANLDELKQSLLQKAFTGQLTAKQLENEVAV